MPRTRALDHAWYDTPNIHLCTIRDFTQLADKAGARIEKALALSAHGTKPIHADAFGPNLTAEGAIFLMNRRGGAAWGPIANRAGSS
jgi:methionine biosynthesis protein MetW